MRPSPLPRGRLASRTSFCLPQRTLAPVGVAFAILSAGPVAAQQETAVSETVVTRITISRDDCARLVRYSKPAGVDYEEGRDVRGRPVAPADLYDAPDAELPHVIEFDLVINPVDFARRGALARRLHELGEPPSPDEKAALERDIQALELSPFDNTRFAVGRVRYDMLTGRLLFNGRPLTDPLAAELAARCQEIRRAGR